MSIVAVHGPNTFGSKGIVGGGAAGATASVNPTNGLIWTLNPSDKSQVAANYDWAYTGLTGTPATPVLNTMSPTITFSGAGTATVTLTLNGVAQAPFTITAVVGAGPRSAPEEEAPTSYDADEGADIVEPEVLPDEPFDPSEHTVSEVEDYVRENPDELETIYDLEAGGKNRSTLISHLESLFPFDPSNYSVEDVKAYVEDNPDEAIDVLNQEKQGKNRSTLVSFLEENSAVE